MQLFLNVHGFFSLPPKRGKKGAVTLNPLEVTLAGGRGDCINGKQCNNKDTVYLFVCSSVIRSSNHSKDPQY